MSKFLRHSSCPRCGSRDNLAEYSNGSAYCFGCHYVKRTSRSPYVQVDNEDGDVNESKVYYLRDYLLGDAFSTESREWLQQSDVGILEAKERGVSWCKSRQQLVFTFRDADGNTILQQGRNFDPLAKSKGYPKYRTYGTQEEVIPIYYCNRETCNNRLQLVIVEDCLSAIKIARQSDSMPVLSSDLSRTKIKRLARLYGAFLVWLDGNMFHKAQRIAQRLELLGCEARAVYTEKDPKFYSDTEISKVLLTGAL